MKYTCIVHHGLSFPALIKLLSRTLWIYQLQKINYQKITDGIHLHARHNEAILQSVSYKYYIIYWQNSFFLNFHLKFSPDDKSDMPIFQCYSETLGSASVKSELCPFILHLYMKNVTAKKIQLSCIFTRQTDCVAKENRFKGEFNLNFTTFPNPIS